MKKISRLFTLSALLCTAGAHWAQGQANDWIIAPDKHMHFTECCNFLSTLPGSSGIANCGAGPGYRWDQYAGVVSDANGNGMAFVNACGTYDPNTGASIGSNTSPYTFAIPGLCKRYYSVGWATVGTGTFRHQELFFRQLDASNAAAIVEASATSVYSNSNVTPIALAPLAADGSRMVYTSNDASQLIAIYVAANGAISPPVVRATLPVGIWDMEVSPDGKKIVINHGSYVTLFDLGTNTEMALGGSFPNTTRISGIEYIPNTGSGDRVYISYHQSASALSFVMEGLGYVNLNAPTILHDALTGMPNTLAKSGFGFTDIERGKNGYLYFTYHPGWGSHWLNNGDVGTMYSSLADVPSYFVPVSPATTVSAIDQNTSGYIIQKQIDGEDYRSFSLAVPTFTVNGKSQTPAFPDIMICDDEDVRLFTYEPGYYSAYTLTFQKGTITGSNFSPGPTFTTGSTPRSKTRDTISIGSYLAGYSGGMSITYTVYNGCSSQSSTQIVNIMRASTKANYKAIAVPSGNFEGSKEIHKTLPINIPMPVAPTLGRFKDSIVAKLGWFGATSAGVNGITTNGNYTLRVYEAMLKMDTVRLPGGNIRIDTSGVRRAYIDINPVTGVRTTDTAPDVCYFTASTPVTNASVRFNGQSLQFLDPSDPDADPRFYFDKTITNQDGSGYFKAYYDYAKLTNTFDDYNKKIWCVDFTVITPEGCVARNISYFRIATNDAISNGGNARPGRTDEEGTGITDVLEATDDAVHVFPNPTSDKVQIRFPIQSESAAIVLYDMYGRTVLTKAALPPGKVTLDLKTLPAGVYSYKLMIDDRAYHGKLIKQ